LTLLITFNCRIMIVLTQILETRRYVHVFEEARSQPCLPTGHSIGIVTLHHLPTCFIHATYTICTSVKL
jgi:hypothetical protein